MQTRASSSKQKNEWLKKNEDHWDDIPMLVQRAKQDGLYGAGCTDHDIRSSITLYLRKLQRPTPLKRAPKEY